MPWGALVTGWKDLVFDIDEGEGLFGDMVAHGGYASYGMANVKRFLTSEDILPLVAPGGLVGVVGGEVPGGDDGADALQGLGLGSVDGLNAGVGVGTAQDPTAKEVGGLEVGAVAGAPRDLVCAIVTDRPGADYIELLIN